MGLEKTAAAGERKPPGLLAKAITGDIDVPATVKVEVIDISPDDRINFNIKHLVDFTSADFYLPLAILFLIFFLQSFSIALGFITGFGILGLYVTLVRDLIKRVNRRPAGKKAVGLSQPYNGKGWLESFGAYFVLLPFIVAALFLNRYLVTLLARMFHLPFLLAGSGQSFGPPPPVMYWVFLFISAVILAPFTEELWFRGLGLAGMRSSHSPLRAALISSVIFGILHGPFRFLHTFVFGLGLCRIRYRTGSLYCCMAVHAFHNALAVALGIYLQYAG